MDKEQTEDCLERLVKLRHNIDIATGKEANDVVEEMMAELVLIHIDKAIESLKVFCNG